MSTQRREKESRMSRNVENLIFIILAVVMGGVLVFSVIGMFTAKPSIAESRHLEVINKEYASNTAYLLLSDDQVYTADRALGIRLNIGDQIIVNRMNNAQFELCIRRHCYGNDVQFHQYGK